MYYEVLKRFKMGSDLDLHSDESRCLDGVNFYMCTMKTPKNAFVKEKSKAVVIIKENHQKGSPVKFEHSILVKG